MLHKNRSNKKNQWKYTLMIPVLALFIMSFNTKEIVTYEPYDTYEEMSSESLYGDVEAIIITKTTSEDKLKEITQSLKEKGITVKFKGVKRNADGEITDISISAKTEKSSANISESNDEGISPIKLSIDGNSISIGNTNAWHHKEGNVVFFNKDGKHKIHKEGKGENVFFFKHDEDGEKHEHEEGEDHEHEYKYKVIEGDDDKIIIKSGAKVIDLKKHKDGNVFFYKGEGDHDVEIIHADSINWKEGQHKFNGNVIIKSDGDGKEENLYIIKKDGKGNVIKEWKEHDVDASEWKVKKGKSFSIRTLGKDKNKIFISSSDSDKEPLVILDGEEITRKEMEKMDSNNIEKVEVLKGESATKKYGDKGKDGVILITSKKKKD